MAPGGVAAGGKRFDLRACDDDDGAVAKDIDAVGVKGAGQQAEVNDGGEQALERRGAIPTPSPSAWQVGTVGAAVTCRGEPSCHVVDAGHVKSLWGSLGDLVDKVLGPPRE
eukprot:7353470-Pyramimonas_sp.AAC.1